VLAGQGISSTCWTLSTVSRV